MENNVKKSKKPRQEKTEEELVTEYANRVIKGKESRGHVDKRFDFTKRETTVNKDLWMDDDFYFSVVFQSHEQKYVFLEFMKKKFGLEINQPDDLAIQIVNGLRLAEKMGCDLTMANRLDFPFGSLDLRDLVLDNETL